MNRILRVVQTAAALEMAAARLLRPFGLSPAQFNILSELAEAADGCRAGDLAAELIVDPSNITRLLQRMKRAKLISTAPDPDDGRALRVKATAAGLERWRKARRAYETALHQLESSARLNAAEGALVDRFLEKLTSRGRELVL